MSVNRRAFSLLEGMVATALLLIILVVAGQAITGALRAQRRGDAHRQAMTFAREALSRIVSEMSASLSLGVLPNGGELVSGVVYPDYAQTPVALFGTGLYQRKLETKTTGDGTSVKVDRAYNRLIFTSPGKRSNQFNDSLTEFVFVEYVVPPRTDNQELPQGRLYRRTYRVMDNPLATLIPGLQVQSNYEMATPTFFALDPADPLGNVNMLEQSLSPERKQERCLVLELPRPDDELRFSVEHNQAAAQRVTPLPRDPAFETGLFTVSVSVSLDREGRDQEGKNKFMASQVISQQVTIRSGY